MKPITTPINRALSGILSDRLKTCALYVCAHEGHQATMISRESIGGNKKIFLFAGC